MAYLGRGIENLSDRVVLDSLTASATASYTLQLNSVNFVPSSAESLTVSLNGVIQAPISSYTVSGSSIVFASSLSASDSIDFIIAERGITLATPSAGSVGTSQLASSAVTPVKLTNETGQLRFIASTTSATNLTTQDVFYKTTWNEQLIDNFNEFSPTDYRFTASEAGTYLFYCSCSFRLNSDQDIGFVAFYKNGSASSGTDVYKHIMGSNNAEGYFTIAYKVALAVNDYIEIYSKWTSQGSNRGFNSGATTGEAIWTGYRIG